MRSDRTQRAGAALLGAVLALLVLFDLLPWRCPFALLFRVPCPTCGLTRAARFALRGDLASAFALYPLWPLMVVVGALAALEVLAFVRHGPLATYRGQRTARALGLAVAALAFLVWVARFFGAFGGPAPI